jgi:arsenate reductase
MSEAGVDISNHRSKHLSEFINEEFDYVITLCSHADKYCPSFPGKTKRVHVPFDDPYSVQGTREFVMSEFARVRDKIRAFIETLPEALEEE